VQEVRSRIEGYEAQGGIEAAVTEKSTAQKVFEVAVGKAVISDFRKPEGEAVATTATSSSSTSALGIAAAARVVLAVVVSEFPYKVCKCIYLSIITYLLSILYVCCYAVFIIIIGHDVYNMTINIGM